MKRETISLAGHEITLETGRIAKQAHGSVLVQQKDTIILATAVAEDEPKAVGDFVPLSVEYRERPSAAGHIPGGFIKRENRPQDHEILTSRLIDRTLRPLFPKDFSCETQIITTVLSFDPQAEPVSLALLGATCALYLSDIPWHGPAGGLHVVKTPQGLLAFPTPDECAQASIDLVVSASQEGLIMVEGKAQNLPEQEILEALFFAQDQLAPFQELVIRWAAELGVKKRSWTPTGCAETLKTEIVSLAQEPLLKALTTSDKQRRHKALKEITEQIIRTYGGEKQESKSQIQALLEKLKRDLARQYMVRENKRLDGRHWNQIRPISGEVGWLPRNHGSALFTRGETQAMVSCTLGTSQDEQVEEDLLGEHRQRFFLHYNFPPYSVGEVSPLRGPGRREIGHGNLAQRALEGVLPTTEEFPYTIRVVSEISESNGSSSMATVCGGCLSLMDAGVPLRHPVAGVAMGLIVEGEKTLILSDILGDEDHLGDMDFKVTGTSMGITAMQMDNKIGSLSREVLSRALDQARQGRLHILQEMFKILSESRATLSPYAPRVLALRIRRSRIRDLIGPGGKNIQEIQENHGVRIEVTNATGMVFIYSNNLKSCENALRDARHLTEELKVGKVYRGKVVGIKDFGAYIRIYASTEGLLHISDLAHERVEKVSDIVREGEEVVVRVTTVDRNGKIRLSRKEALDIEPAEIVN